MKFRDFIMGVFSDGGSPSFSRVATGVAVGFGCGWVTAIVRFTHALPDFTGLVMFISVLYGVNVAGSVVAKKLSTTEQNQPEEKK